MDDALRAGGWIVVFIVIAAYMTFLASNAAFNSHEASSTPIVIRDIMQKGEHHLYGKIVVPSSCDEVSVKTVSTGESSYELVFTTWQEPEVTCIKSPAERVFDTVVFTPSIGVKITASVDKQEVPTVLFPTISN